MNCEAFKEYVMTHCHAVRDFRNRAVIYQRLRFAQRSGKTVSDQVSEEEVVEAMVDRFVDSAYYNLKRYVKEDAEHPRQSWIDFIARQDVLASLEVSAWQVVLRDE